MTKLQEARQRVREAEALEANTKAKHEAEDKAQAPAQAALERWRKSVSKQPVVILTAGSYRVLPTGLAAVSGYGWDYELRKHLDGQKGKAAEAAVAAAILGGAVTMNVGGGSPKCKGLAAKTRVPDAASLRAWRAAHEKVRKAEAAARTAREAEVAAIRAAFDAGAKVAAEDVAALFAKGYCLLQATAKTSTYGRDHEITTARKTKEAAIAHLAHVQSKSKDPCACATCENDRAVAEVKTRDAERQRERAKAEAAWQKIVDRAPWREFTCPSCAKVVQAQVLPVRTYAGEYGAMSLKCPTPMCGRTTPAASLRTKPVKAAAA